MTSSVAASSHLAVVEWHCESQGLGTTEYAADLGGRCVEVTFEGDHKTDWTGAWQARAADRPDVAIAAGRLTLPTHQPTDAEVVGQLDDLLPLLLTALAS